MGNMTSTFMFPGNIPREHDEKYVSPCICGSILVRTLYYTVQIFCAVFVDLVSLDVNDVTLVSSLKRFRKVVFFFLLHTLKNFKMRK